MGLKRFSIGALILVSSLNAVLAQTKSWTFEDEMCTYKGYYDNRKYTAQQLADTYALFRTNHYVHNKGTLKELTERYDSVIRSVKNLETVQTPYFLQFKMDVIRYLQETAALKKVQKTAKVKPERLISAVKEGTLARKYAEALYKGGDELLEAYAYVIKQQMKNNSTPEYLWYNYETTMKRSDKLDRAFEYVLVYGWWNNANDLVRHIRYDGTQMEQFQKLFIKVDTLDCDEP